MFYGNLLNNLIPCIVHSILISSAIVISFVQVIFMSRVETVFVWMWNFSTLSTSDSNKSKNSLFIWTYTNTKSFYSLSSWFIRLSPFRQLHNSKLPRHEKM